MLAADANRGWSVECAIELAPSFAEYNLAWLEEPIRADRPWQEWQLLRKNVRTPLAAGENIASRAGFTQALGDGVLSVVQPDIAKWGGLSVVPVSRGTSSAPAKPSARIISAAASACLPRRICSPASAAMACWRSTPTTILCAIVSRVRSPKSATARSRSRRRPASASVGTGARVPRPHSSSPCGAARTLQSLRARK